MKSTTETHTWTCDMLGCKETHTGTRPPANWGNVWFRSLQEDVGTRATYQDMDLCEGHYRYMSVAHSKAVRLDSNYNEVPD